MATLKQVMEQDAAVRPHACAAWDVFTQVLEPQHLGPFLSQVRRHLGTRGLLHPRTLPARLQIVVILLPHVDAPECTPVVCRIFHRLFVQKQEGLRAFFRY